MALFSGFANIGKVPELRKRLLFTLVMLAVYRIGVFVTIPGVDRNVMQAVVSKQGGGLLGLFNMFSGGALGNLSIFALGIMPYVSASIVLQLLTMVYKPLDTEWLQEARAHGLRTVDGLEMLIRQAIPSYRAFYGAEPPDLDVRPLLLEAGAAG